MKKIICRGEVPEVSWELAVTKQVREVDWSVLVVAAFLRGFGETCGTGGLSRACEWGKGLLIRGDLRTTVELDRRQTKMRYDLFEQGGHHIFH